MTDVNRYSSSIIDEQDSQLRAALRGLFRVSPVYVFLSLLTAAHAPWVLAKDGQTQPLKLVELYTSHGCSSCPPADELLGELLANDDDLLALEFHVDYWNTLVHGKDGSFTDPFSSASHSQRQREYNAANLAGRPGVYTPQVIVNGRVATVGNNRRHIEKALSKTVEPALDIRITDAAVTGSLSVVVEGAEQRRKALKGTNIAVVRYVDRAETEITGGENNGKTLTNHHVVTAFTLLGEVLEQGDMIFSVDDPGDGEGCVVLIQEEASSPVYAAAACP